ncbi:VpaChn25_0724 family phage protein [Pseudogemmobacter sonorensis]|uniref:VpaChn25_0724 family phage protein n=1 Tax=Pseudogemmobacter sonorensis TaxID=2989681 RepID=UPI0036BFAB09
MTNYAEHIRRHRRLAILRHLEACSEYTSNVSILSDVLRGVGVQSTRSQVVTELAWLKENGFVTAIDHGDFVVATATVSGAEIARGVTTHPEIQRPQPRG